MEDAVKTICINTQVLATATFNQEFISSVAAKSLSQTCCVPSGNNLLLSFTFVICFLKIAELVAEDGGGGEIDSLKKTLQMCNWMYRYTLIQKEIKLILFT